MKYTSNQINAMSFLEWTESMADELNKAGYMEEGKVPYSVSEPKYFLLGSVTKAEEIEHLKSLGLLNNGRCPMCGSKIVDSPGRFTSGYDYNYHFQVCQNCVRRRKGISVNSASKQGCIIALLLFPWNILKSVLNFNINY
jgi:hypothetical protein